MHDHLFPVGIIHLIGENAHVQPTILPCFGFYTNVVVWHGFWLQGQFHYLAFRLANQMPALIVTMQKVITKLTGYIMAAKAQYGLGSFIPEKDAQLLIDNKRAIPGVLESLK